MRADDEIDLASWDHMLLSDLVEAGPMSLAELQQCGLPPEVPPAWVQHALAGRFIEVADDRYRISPLGREHLARLGDDPDDEISVGLPAL